MANRQSMPVTCSKCGTQFNAPYQNIINGQNPAMKNALLQGRVNAAQCPRCGIVSMIGLPLLYYDLKKELSFVLVQNGLADQNKIVGDLTNLLMNSLKPEQKKFYLLNPTQFFSMETLAKSILMADGITEEMMNMQQAKAKLIEDFLQAKTKEELDKKAKKHKAELDDSFFEILTGILQDAQQMGDQKTVEAIFALREYLAQLSSKNKEIVAKIDKKLGLFFVKSYADLLERFINVKDEQEFEDLIATGYSMLDYQFFQQLTTEVDRATASKNIAAGQKIKNLRDKILNGKLKYEEKIRLSSQKAAKLIQDILQSTDPAKVMAQRVTEIDQTFFSMLAANIQEAQKSNNSKMAMAFDTIGNMAMSMIYEHMGDEEKEEELQTPSPPSQIDIARL